MPRWICPSCNTSMKVKADLVGTLQRCLSCDAEDLVIDADAVSLPRPMMPPPMPTPIVQVATPSAPPEVTIEPEGAEFVTTGARILCVLIPILAISVGALMRDNPEMKSSGSYLVFTGIAAAIEVCLIWPFYTMCDDTRANRRLLQKIADNLNKPIN